MLLPLQLNLSVTGPAGPSVTHVQIVGLVGRLATCAGPTGRLATCSGVVGRVPTLSHLTGVL